eukprot:6207823-Pleurochrysis_carterae.AAC.4
MDVGVHARNSSVLMLCADCCIARDRSLSCRRLNGIISSRATRRQCPASILPRFLFPAFSGGARHGPSKLVGARGSFGLFVGHAILADAASVADPLLLNFLPVTSM